MYRDISLLDKTLFDAVIVGGGIHGATAFQQLSQAGLKVALIEQNDFGGATSANSLKILHGGLRYLQHLNFKRMRESINSRKYFMEVAPHLVEPMPCIMPTYGMGMQGKPVMGLAMAMFDLISCDRNSNAPDTNKVGHSRLLSRKECLQIGPGIALEGLTGAALWYDDLITNTERMVLSFVCEGCRAGAMAANYTKATKINHMNSQVTGLEVLDVLTDTSFTLQTPLVINASGPWLNEVIQGTPTPDITKALAKAVNIVVNKPLFKDYGVGLAGTKEYQDQDAKIKRGKRLYFFAPWKGQTIIGTTYTHYNDRAGDLKVTPDDIEEIIEEVNAIYPMAQLSKNDVIFSHTGLMPAHNRESSEPQLVKHSRVIDHSEQGGLNGLFTIEGVKYTTAPAIARDTLQVVNNFRKKSSVPPGGTQPEPQAELNEQDQKLLDKYQSQFPHIQANFGPDSLKVFKIIDTETGTAGVIRHDPLLLEAEVLFSTRQEMAVKLSDIVLRRTDCGTTGCPSDHVLHHISRIMAVELNWDESTIAAEKEELLAHFHHILSTI